MFLNWIKCNNFQSNVKRYFVHNLIEPIGKVKNAKEEPMLFEKEITKCYDYKAPL